MNNHIIYFSDKNDLPEMEDTMRKEADFYLKGAEFKLVSKLNDPRFSGANTVEWITK